MAGRQAGSDENDTSVSHFLSRSNSAGLRRARACARTNAHMHTKRRSRALAFFFFFLFNACVCVNVKRVHVEIRAHARTHTETHTRAAPDTRDTIPQLLHMHTKKTLVNNSYDYPLPIPVSCCCSAAQVPLCVRACACVSCRFTDAAFRCCRKKVPPSRVNMTNVGAGETEGGGGSLVTLLFCSIRRVCSGSLN